ncbi:MAG: hypothetical protein EB150_07740 [Nitrososphaeria archaeon]|jgi:hypothetical protein|nr:hypothetical protein [Nitrososphaeria archaeon]
MCVECGCNNVGSPVGVTPVSLIDMTSQGNAGLTLDMSATRGQMQEFIEEDPVHEMREGTEDPD